MVGPLLETKFHVPTSRGDRVQRPRLSERLSRGAHTSLTLLSAPAGFGKTTLLTEWLAIVAEGRSVAWISLDERDNDPVQYWTYVVTALTTTAPALGSDAIEILQGPQPSIDAAITALVNDLARFGGEVVLVLDDYHVIDAPEVHDGMAFLLEHVPANVHLVIASRADPTFPLGATRARGDLVEIRAADLSFTPEEAAAYLNGVMGLTLTAADITALEQRTEGWIAALQLAALSMQGRDDATAFIAGFAGDDRYVVDYLAEEVLSRQSTDIREFLLRTSVLDRLGGPLCDAVTGQAGGKAMLAALERGNLFLVPLDDRRHWYRYHQLFGDVLQAHLLDERPDEVAGLHDRASRWYSENGQATEAIRHALAAGAVERAAQLVEHALPDWNRDRQEATMRRWLTALPDSIVRVRPLLSIGYVGSQMIRGDTEGVEQRLVDAERWLDPATGRRRGAAEDSADNDEVLAPEYRRLPGMIETYRAALALLGGDLAGTVVHSRLALDLMPEDDQLGRAPAAGILGLAAWTTGDLVEAHRSYAECMAGLAGAGHVSDALGCAIALGDIRIAQGRLGDAERTYEQALHDASEHDASGVRGVADMYVALAEVHRQRGDLPRALSELQRSHELGEHFELPQNRYRWSLAMARVRQTEGDQVTALDLLDEAEQTYAGDYFPNVRPIPAVRARMQSAFGDPEDALAWAQARGLSASDDVSYLTEYEHLALARALVEPRPDARSEGELDEAIELLDRQLLAAEAGDRVGSVIEILVVQALARQAKGDAVGALDALRRALEFAEPEGYVQAFMDEGPAMTRLLRAAAKKGPSSSYARQLVAATVKVPDVAAAERAGGTARLVDPLSERELDVLRLLASDLDGPAIARELFVSLNTVRTHTKSIYAKLGVNSRRGAVRSARELGVLPGSAGTS